ncbi:MAG: hypothetical protein GY786_18475 [Proteobacteria bacterium]|nr:hypothetical protein [Pseudomonadota bacterium]
MKTTKILTSIRWAFLYFVITSNFAIAVEIEEAEDRIVIDSSKTALPVNDQQVQNISDAVILPVIKDEETDQVKQEVQSDVQENQVDEGGPPLIDQIIFTFENWDPIEDSFNNHLSAGAIILISAVLSLDTINKYNDLATKNRTLDRRAKVALNLSEYQSYTNKIEANRSTLTEYQESINNYNGLLIIGLFWEGLILKPYLQSDQSDSTSYIPKLKIRPSTNTRGRNVSMILNWKF